MNIEVSYGKEEITFYRTYASPQCGIRSVPESSFRGKKNTLFALTITMEVFGDCFVSAYTAGDNRSVIATDSMKNFVLQQALAFGGSTLESFLVFLGQRFLAKYPQVHSLQLTGKERPFLAVSVPQKDHEVFVESAVLFSQSHNDHAFATLRIERDGDRMKIVAHQCGHRGLQLIKITGSSFENFLSDTYTTLPQRVDRPLFIYLDISWQYADISHMVKQTLSDYIASEQVRDIAQAVFQRFVSKSIQHLVYEMGVEILKEFPQMSEISFVAQNRLWETACIADADPALKVYIDPHPPYGTIKLHIKQEALRDQQHREDGVWQVNLQPTY